MNTRHTLIAIGVAAALAAGGYALYQVGMHRGMGQAGGAAAPATASAVAEDPTSSIAAGEAATRRHIQQGIKAGDIDPATGKPVLYYHDPMVPGKRFDAPAKSPFMNMMLVPVYGGAGGDDQGTVTVSPRIQQNLGVRTAEVVEGVLQPMVSAVGSIAWNGVVVLFVQIGALCSENPLHDKHLRFRHFRALHPFRADWCALAPVAVRVQNPEGPATCRVRPLRSGRETPA